MKICKYYSMDECSNTELVIKKLDDLQDDSKIEYFLFEDDDVFKIKSIGLSAKEKKDILSFFRENDVIDYPDYEEYYDDDEEDDDEEEEEEYEY